MLHACVQKFDVTGNLEKFWEPNMASVVQTTVNLESFCYPKHFSTGDFIVTSSPDPFCIICFTNMDMTLPT